MLTFTDATKTRFGMRLSYRTALLASRNQPAPVWPLVMHTVIAEDLVTRRAILSRVVL